MNQSFIHSSDDRRGVSTQLGEEEKVEGVTSELPP